ncbi:leucine-rich repeat receptor-like serine/threonine-protein kinase BAM1 [Beta vulgaris subsp. vulgaris]|uniref:leucine-rich repeat receptor-like serine/threonine-protein kinase BAM1 n=1 Tax=Beta vulgaris subsp. vulgaris TaxID=3555 RepID=UPI002036B5D0|nr:leucine-rich repeat receptor-like serine/threonine-protein kinase BAM1 [Beta vulgaris subsp. vulgaris]
MGLIIHRDTPLTLHTYSDSDWARDKDDYISTTTYIVYLGKNAISWTSHKQRTRARSSTEAEYRAVANTTAELLWVNNLLAELGHKVPLAPFIYCDNVGATYVSANPVEGLVLDHGSRHPDMKRRAENCYILTCNVSLECEERTLPEQKALLGIKSAITDDPQSSLSSWKTSTHHCTWDFIKCSSSSSLNHHQTVVSLNISGLNLTGILSPDIGFLTNLQNLSVAGNSFSGPIPSSLSLLSNLYHLNLSNNIFNSTFPSSLSPLKNLPILDVYNNNLTGPLPLSVVNMSELRHLHLGGNYFSGEIPVEYGQWRKIEYLAVFGNELEGNIPAEIGNLSPLKELYIGYYNGYSGGIPPEGGAGVEGVEDC